MAKDWTEDDILFSLGFGDDTLYGETQAQEIDDEVETAEQKRRRKEEEERKKREEEERKRREREAQEEAERQTEEAERQAQQEKPKRRIQVVSQRDLGHSVAPGGGALGRGLRERRGATPEYEERVQEFEEMQEAIRQHGGEKMPEELNESQQELWKEGFDFQEDSWAADLLAEEGGYTSAVPQEDFSGGGAWEGLSVDDAKDRHKRIYGTELDEDDYKAAQKAIQLADLHAADDRPGAAAAWERSTENIGDMLVGTKDTTGTSFQDIPRKYRQLYLERLANQMKERAPRAGALGAAQTIGRESQEAVIGMSQIPVEMMQMLGLLDETKSEDLDFFNQIKAIKQGLDPGVELGEGRIANIAESAVEDVLAPTQRVATEIMADAATMGTTRAAGAARLGLKARNAQRLGSAAATAQMFSRIAPNSYDYLREQGMSDEEARAAAVVSGVVQAGLEKLQLGGFIGRGTLPKLTERINKRLATTTKGRMLQGLGRYGTTVAAETSIEGMQAFIDPAIKELTDVLKEDETVEFTPALEAAINELKGSAGIMALLTAPQAIGGLAGARAQQRQYEVASKYLDSDSKWEGVAETLDAYTQAREEGADAPSRKLWEQLPEDLRKEIAPERPNAAQRAEAFAAINQAHGEYIEGRMEEEREASRQRMDYERRRATGELTREEQIEEAYQEDAGPGVQEAFAEQEAEKQRQVEQMWAEQRGQEAPAEPVEQIEVPEEAQAAPEGTLMGEPVGELRTGDDQAVERVTEHLQKFKGRKGEPGGAVQAAGQVLGGVYTDEELEQIASEKEGGKFKGEPTEEALYQIAEWVEEVAGDPDIKPTGNEKKFFAKGGILDTAWRKVQKRLGEAGASALNKANLKVLEEAREAKPDADPFKHAEDFEKVLNKRGSNVIVKRAVQDYLKFARAEEFEKYYSELGYDERQQLIQKYPEFRVARELTPDSEQFAGEDGDYNFVFYQMLNAVASAQTNLDKNTQETNDAYGGFRQTGQVPVTFAPDPVSGKVKPVYQLPTPDDSPFDAPLQRDIDNIVTTLTDLAPKIPEGDIAVLTGRAPIPEGLTKLTPGNKGKAVRTYKDYVYDWFAPTYVTAETAKKANTTSKALVSKMLAEFVLTGEGGFRSKIRSAFEIGGGSSSYNKARNYAALNQLIRERFSTDGRPDIRGLVDYLNERVPMSEIREAKKALGFGDINASDRRDIEDTVWAAEDQSKLVPRTFIFGPKVGAYMLNRMSALDPRNADYNTMDVWESRFWRGFNPSLNDPNPGIASGTYRKIYMRQARDFAREYKKQTGRDLKVSAGQAGRWYLMKEAVGKAGYLKAGEDKTIAQYTGDVMDQYIQNELGGLRGEPQLLEQLWGEEVVAEGDVEIAPKTIKRTAPKTTKAPVEEVATIGQPAPEVKPPSKAKAKRLQKKARKAEAVQPSRPEFEVNMLFQTKGGDPVGLMQVIEKDDNAIALLKAFEGSDIDTGIEEMAHAMRRMIVTRALTSEQRGFGDEMLDMVEQHYGVQDGKWNREQEESFARDFRKYLQTAKAPTAKLEKPMQKLRSYLTNLFNKVKQGMFGVEVAPEMAGFFDQLLTRRQRLRKAGISVPKKATQRALRGQIDAPKEKDRKPESAKADAGTAASLEATKAAFEPEERRGEASLDAIEAEGNTGTDAETERTAGVPAQYVDSEGNVVLYRYSKGDRGETYEIDPAKTKPSPYSRNDYQRASTPRTFFYLNTSDKETMIGGNLYVASVKGTEIYNLIKDPLGLKKKHPQADSYDFDAIFRELMDQGYKGVYYKPGFHVVNLFEKVEGTKTEDIGRNVDREKSGKIWSGVQTQIRNKEPAGFTYDPKTGEFKKNGYAVAPSKSSEFVIDLGEAKSWEVPQLIQRYAGRVAAQLAEDNMHLGGWVDDGKLYLDVSIVVPNKETAIEIAKANDQEGIFDLNTGETIYTKPREGDVDAFVPGSGPLTSTIDSKEAKKREAKPRRQIVADLLDMAGITLSPGDFEGGLRNAAGYYRWINKWGVPGRELALRKDYLADVGVAIHEIAHFLDDKFNITGRKQVGGVETGLGRLANLVASDPAYAGAIAKMAQYDYDPNQMRLHEGFAETVRLYVTHPNPEQILDSDVLDLLNTIMLNDEIRNIVTEARADVLAYDAQNDFEKINHALHSPGDRLVAPNDSYFAKFDNKWWRAFKRLSNRMLWNKRYDLALAEQQMEKWFKEYWNGLSKDARGGVTADEAWEATLQKTGGLASQMVDYSMQAAQRGAEVAMETGIHDGITGNKVGKGLNVKDIFKDFDENQLSTFGNYMYAKVALERLARAVSKGKDYIVGEADPDRLAAFVSQVESGPDAKMMDKAAKDLTAYFNNLVDLQVEVGLIGKKEGDVIKKSHELYMPFIRQFRDDNIASPRGFLGVKAAVRRLKGGSVMPVLRVEYAIADRTLEVYQAVHRHRVERAFIETAKQSGVGAPFITRVVSKELGLSKADLIQKRINRGEISQEAGEAILADESISVEDLVNSGQPGRDNSDYTYVTYRNPDTGQDEVYRVDPNVYQAMTRAGSPDFSRAYVQFMNFFGLPTKTARYAMVTLNVPYFMPKNLVRDNKTALIKGLQDTGDWKGNLAETFPDMVQTGAKSVKELGRGTKQLFTKGRSDVDKLYNLHGGDRMTRISSADEIAGGGLWARARARREQRRVFGRGRRARGVDRAISPLLAAGEHLEAVNNIVELAPRKAAFFMSLRLSGEHTGQFKVNSDGSIEGEVPQWAITRAMHNALEATVNFNRRGELAPWVEPYFLFFNAAMQGTYSQALTIKNAIEEAKRGNRAPATRVAANLALGVTAKLAAFYYMARTLIDDDDEEKGTLLDMYMETPEYLKRDYDVMPMKVNGEIQRLFLPKEREYKFLSNLVDLMLTRVEEGKRGADLKWDEFAGQAASMLSEEVSSRIPFTGGTLPAGVQLYTGQNWFYGRDIETDTDKDQLAPLRADDHTTSIGQWISNAMYDSKFTRWADISPKEVDFVVRNSLGSMPFTLHEWLTSPKNPDDAPFIGPFIGDEVPRKTITQVYELSNLNTQKLNALRKPDSPITFSAAEEQEIYDNEVVLAMATRVMSAIKDSSLSDEMKDKLRTGIGRWALGKKELAEYPNPLLQYDNEDLPLSVRREVANAIKSLSKTPTKRGIETPEGMQRFEGRVKARTRIGRKVQSLLENEE